MSMKTIPRLHVQWVATVDQGKQVELLEADAEGREVDGGVEVARVFADDAERQWVDIYLGDGAVRVPLSDLREALDYAAATAKSEKFFDRESGDVDAPSS